MEEGLPDRVKEGRKWLNIAKQHVGDSRNLRSDLKKGILKAIDQLYHIIKTGEERVKEVTRDETGTPGNEDRTREGRHETPHADREQHLAEKLEAHAQLLKQHTEEVIALKKTLERSMEREEKVLAEIGELKTTTLELGGRVLDTCAASTSANATKTPPHSRLDILPSPSYAVIVRSDTIEEEGGDLTKRVKMALKAKEKGIQIHSVKRIRDNRIVVKCNNKEELEKATKQLKNDRELEVEHTTNKNPLVVLRNVLVSVSDDDVLTALRNQNARLVENLSVEESVAMVKYRRRARNPLESHVVLQVSPMLWRRLTEAGRVYIDVQRVRVEDQTPLVQCSRCLAYGHGRRLCLEEVETCHHCGGPHMQAECPDRAAGLQRSCVNCRRSKNADDRHAVYSNECPVRRKFEVLARQTTTYC